MSTVKANTYQDASGGNTATINSMTPTADSLQGFRNRIINGDMRIDQRNAGASVNLSATSQYTIDRWDVRLGTSTGSTTQQSTTAPAGFTNSLLLTIGTGASPSASAGTGYLDQTIEGFNTADLGWGAAGAKTITLSFWVRSSLTGSFGVCVTNDGINPSYPTSYTINSANTWEYKTITVPGPTTGTFNTNNAGGIRLFFDWGNGSNFKGTADTWANADYRGGATGTTSICATSGATWRITGVQLEVGSTATPFERRPYGTELALCQRYFQRLNSLSGNYVAFGSGRGDGTTTVTCYIKYANTVRATPTISQSNTGVNFPTQATITSLGSIYYGTDSAAVALTTASTVTSGTAVLWLGDNNASGRVDISAEL